MLASFTSLKNQLAHSDDKTRLDPLIELRTPVVDPDRTVANRSTLAGVTLVKLATGNRTAVLAQRLTKGLLNEKKATTGCTARTFALATCLNGPDFSGVRRLHIHGERLRSGGDTADPLQEADDQENAAGGRAPLHRHTTRDTTAAKTQRFGVRQDCLDR